MLTQWTGSLNEPIWIKPSWPIEIARGLFSFRTHGVSEGPFASLNVGYHVPDQPDAVTENRRRIARELGGDLEDWVVAEQVHGTHVAVVHQAHRGQGATPALSPVPGVDALVTQEPGLTLVVMSADCVPMLFFDPVQRAIGVAHSGWKGTV
ncbi:MAG: polyphenol oxidase family protein, partial [Alicyclobacillus sp.]|nr:polyphenol oxidase family protein [Alicyclobacillus sp.]